jgi:hypothetical protein
MMPGNSEGGCQCGAIRYRLTAEPKVLAVCHCKECQRQSGSAFGMSLIVSQSGFELLSGSLKSFTRSADSGRQIECRFCGDCGTRICHVPTYADGVLNVKAGTLDDTSWLQPAVQVWTRSKQPWVAMPDDLPAVEGQP